LNAGRVPGGQHAGLDHGVPTSFEASRSPNHARLAGAAFWLVGPYLAGRPSDLRVLRLDADADDTFDATGALDGIRCPMLVISGRLDLAYPPDLTREFVAGLPNARHIAYPDVGHGFGAGSRFAGTPARSWPRPNSPRNRARRGDNERLAGAAGLTVSASPGCHRGGG
jgi:hypothetical protein